MTEKGDYMKKLGISLLIFEVIFILFMSFSSDMYLFIFLVIIGLGILYPITMFIYNRYEPDWLYFIPSGVVIIAGGILLIIVEVKQYGLGGLILVIPGLILLFAGIITSTIYLVLDKER